MTEFPTSPRFKLADWRRRVNDLYSEIRAMPDPRAGWTHWHKVKSALYRDHEMSPIPEDQREGFEAIDIFDYDPDLRFAVKLTPVKAGLMESAALGGDGEIRYTAVGRTRGLMDALGGELTVYWIEGYGGGLFVPFKDATNGAETYGGGRYILDAIKGADLGEDMQGRLILDFNFAYNPSCALNDAYVCPLPPPGNTLPKSVRVGERLRQAA